MNSQQPNLLIDGYIAYTFGSAVAEGYHASLLKREPRDINCHTQVSGSLLFFFAASPGTNGPWTIDYRLKDAGLVIPQQIWVPPNMTEVQRYVAHFQLCPPIFLVHRDSSDLGFPLTDVAAGNCLSLRDADQMAPVGTSAHAQVRINWCGYAPWDDQINLRNQRTTPGRETVSLVTFAKYVAGRVVKFMKLAESLPYNAQDQRWFIGENRITLRDVILIGVVQVSQGSWMPILQLNDRFVGSLGIMRIDV